MKIPLPIEILSTGGQVKHGILTLLLAGFILFHTGSTMAEVARNKWTGDYETLIEHRIIRALVPYSKTFYFLDKGHPRGLTHENFKAFEKMINIDLKTRHLSVHVVIIPTSREQLIPALISGQGDIVAGNLTITGPREKKVDFAHPLLTGVSEILVTGPKAPPIKAIEDLSGKRIHVRPSSSYYESIGLLNQKFKTQGKRKIRLIKEKEFMEDEDLMEMANAGMIPMLVVDNHKAEFWAQIFKNITLHPHIVLRDNGEVAWAVRKNSPQLLAVINKFIKKNKKGTLLGNILFQRYLEDTGYVTPEAGNRDRFQETAVIFKKYANQYDFDWLLLKALAFQESGIDQGKKSPRGAVGVMQILPSTARDPHVNIKDIHKLDNNIHAGTKYLRFLKDRYFSDPEISDVEQTLLSLAAYNAGPRQMIAIRKDTAARNLDPNVWFKNVEVATAKRIGRETVQYVNNIFKYYLTYSRIHELENKKQGR